jgi:hypothetical protein
MRIIFVLSLTLLLSACQPITSDQTSLEVETTSTPSATPDLEVDPTPPTSDDITTTISTTDWINFRNQDLSLRYPNGWKVHQSTRNHESLLSIYAPPSNIALNLTNTKPVLTGIATSTYQASLNTQTIELTEYILDNQSAYAFAELILNGQTHYLLFGSGQPVQYTQSSSNSPNTYQEFKSLFLHLLETIEINK